MRVRVRARARQTEQPRAEPGTRRTDYQDQWVSEVPLDPPSVVALALEHPVHRSGPSLVY